MDKINQILTRGVTNIIPNKEKLAKLLASKKNLNVYLGIDPTATHIHLGNAVPLRKLQQFVDLGANVTFLIGDFTALIGDTSDKETERPVLTYDQIQENFKTYEKQASKILDFSKVKIVHNSEWLKKLTFEEIIKLTQHFSFGDFSSRELISKRLKEKKHVGLHEAIYPAIQGYDSYHLNTDIQIGGADQTFNMQAGRILQKDLRKKESFIIVTGYLEGTDGRKMSKSWGNAIWLDDKPDDMFGKIMSVKDDLIFTYYNLATNLAEEEVEMKKKRFDKGENPMVIKKELAFEIVKELHTEKDAKMAEENFSKTFQQKIPKYSTYIHSQGTLAKTIAQLDNVGTLSEAKRLISQGAVDVKGVPQTNKNYEVKIGDEIKIGERNFVKVK